ncbi:hypothetical protein B296_00032961 [Ensete ventricosum]|uniref:Transposase (putative) gypsy type domain-containing protein n=1 Tax=Ensete ventricosum TaxID=4639 RepID=A0A426Y4C5_ENSVE|nr:hypothetical protein B296_00032961 [Ensete ventricosum]
MSSGSSSVRSVPSTGSEGTRSKSIETSVSGSISSRMPSLVDAKSLRELEFMKSCQDIASVVTEESIGLIRECYSIPEEYVLCAPLPEQRPYNPKSIELSISMDTLEVSLCFPLHPTIVDCLRWWRISSSQVAPNSLCYLVAFLNECRGASLIPSRTLFFTCFHLYKSLGGYYLTARADFKVNGTMQDAQGVKRQNYCSCSSPALIARSREKKVIIRSLARVKSKHRAGVRTMRLETRLECIGSSQTISVVCQDGAREFVGRRSRLVGRLSGGSRKACRELGRS